IDLFSNPINRANTIQKQLFLYLPVLSKRPDMKLEKRSNIAISQNAQKMDKMVWKYNAKIVIYIRNRQKGCFQSPTQPISVFVQ
ncbi:MAG: hypothetical protein LBJ67_16890, partial [Planctomycetaceae bacterium]|nr:hypothetical protein [Planctomycetaceae bacterium]